MLPKHKNGFKAFLGRFNFINYIIWLVFFMAIFAGKMTFSANSFVRQLFTMGFFVLGAGLEMLLGDIDLCFMAQAAISTVIFALIYQKSASLAFAAAVVFVLFVLTCALKGFAISRFGIPSIILTFALQTIFINLWSSTDIIVLGISTYKYYTVFVAVSAFVFVLCGIFEWYLLDKTYWGKYCIAIGENAKAVKQSGVDAETVRVLIHCIAAVMFFIGTMALLFVAPYGGTNRDSSYLFQVIAAASLGGVTVNKRGAEVCGLIAGIVSMVMLQQIITAFSLSAYAIVVEGAIILLTFFAHYYNKNSEYN